MKYSHWSIYMLEKLKEASKLKKINMDFKRFCEELIENGDTPFDLVYSSTRDKFKGLIFRCDNVGAGTLKFILKNHGKQLFLKVKNDKRI